MWFSVLLLFCLFWIPLIVRNGKDAVHFCPSCGLRLATWFSSPKFIAIEPGLQSNGSFQGDETADVEKSPLGPPTVQKSETSKTRKILRTVEFSHASDAWNSGVCNIISTHGSSGEEVYLADIFLPPIDAIPPRPSPWQLKDFPRGTSHVVIYEKGPLEAKHKIRDITYSTKSWDVRLRAWDGHQIRNGRPLQTHLMTHPVLQSIKSIIFFQSSHGLLRWDTKRSVRGHGRGWPLVDRWDRVCALYRSTSSKTPFSGRLIIFEGDSTQSPEDSRLWIEEIITATLAVMPQEWRREQWYKMTFPGTYNYSPGN